MANPLCAVEGEIVDVVLATGSIEPGYVKLERLNVRSRTDAAVIISVANLDVPADLLEQFRVGVRTRLALFGAPALRSRFLAGTFNDTTYVRLPPNLQAMRNWTFGLGATLDAGALACVYFMHLWGAIPGIILLLLSLGPFRMARALPTYAKVQRLLGTIA